MRARLQPVQVVWVIAAPPAVEALPTDTEMATGEGRVASVMQVVIHPLEPPNRLAAQLPPQLRQLADSGWLSPSNLHGDTLLRVSPIILNENRAPVIRTRPLAADGKSNTEFSVGSNLSESEQLHSGPPHAGHFFAKVHPQADSAEIDARNLVFIDDVLPAIFALLHNPVEHSCCAVHVRPD